MLEICRESNYDTYGEVLTLNKLERTIGDGISVDGRGGGDENHGEAPLACLRRYRYSTVSRICMTV